MLNDDQKDVVEVTVLTRHQALKGMLHLPKTAKSDRRLTELLNSNRRFIALTNVEITDRASGRVTAFLHRNDIPYGTGNTEVSLPPGLTHDRRKSGRDMGQPEGVKRSAKTELPRHPFVQVNVDAIELLIPHGLANAVYPT